MKFLAAKQPVFKAALILAGAVTLAATGAASAATVSASQNFSGSASAGFANLSFSQFDTSLGTLTSVGVSLSGTFDTSLQVINFSGNSGAVSNGSVKNVGLTLSGPNGSAAFTAAAAPGLQNVTGTATPAVIPNIFPSLTTLGDLQESLTSSFLASALSAYEGSGSVAISLAVGNGTSSGSCATGDSSFCGFGFALSGSGTVTVDYTYTAASTAETPLPAALPLFASGLGAMGVLGWRRKRKAKTAS